MKLVNSIFQVSQLGSIFYIISISRQSFQSVVLQSIIYLSLVTLLLSILWIWLGRQIGLGTPLLTANVHKQSGKLKIFLRDAKLSILPGYFYVV